MTKKPKPMPKFTSEEEELKFWDEHDPSEYFTEPTDVIVRLKSQRKKVVPAKTAEGLRRA